MSTVISNVDLRNMAKTEAVKPAGQSFFSRLIFSMSRRAEQNAMARLAALDPRLAAEIRAARDRTEREASEGAKV